MEILDRLMKDFQELQALFTEQTRTIQLQEDRMRLLEATLVPFAQMHRKGDDDREMVASRGKCEDIRKAHEVLSKSAFYRIYLKVKEGTPHE